MSTATVDAWELVLLKAYDDDLILATADVLETWETTFLPPPGVILQASQRRTHGRLVPDSLSAQERLTPAETKGWVTKLLAAARKMN